MELTKLGLGIECNVFQNAEETIKNAEIKIEEARSIKERQYYTQDIMLEVKTLSTCSNYNAGNPCCLSCRTILRRHT